MEIKEYYYLDNNNKQQKQRVIGENKIADYAVINKLHNISGPAFLSFIDGKISSKEWFTNGIMTRLDGPAVIRFYKESIQKKYVIDNNYYSIREFAKETNHVICEICWDFCNQECFY